MRTEIVNPASGMGGLNQQQQQQASSIPTEPVSPASNDILFGRGRRYDSHPGNLKLRALVDSNVVRYHNTVSRSAKTRIAQEVLRKVTFSGRFLKYDEGTETWVQVTGNPARIKVSQAFRYRQRQIAGEGGRGANGNMFAPEVPPTSFMMRGAVKDEPPKVSMIPPKGFLTSQVVNTGSTLSRALEMHSATRQQDDQALQRHSLSLGDPFSPFDINMSSGCGQGTRSASEQVPGAQGNQFHLNNANLLQQTLSPGPGLMSAPPSTINTNGLFDPQLPTWVVENKSNPDPSTGLVHSLELDGHLLSDEEIMRALGHRNNKHALQQQQSQEHRQRFGLTQQQAQQRFQQECLSHEQSQHLHVTMAAPASCTPQQTSQMRDGGLYSSTTAPQNTTNTGTSINWQSVTQTALTRDNMYAVPTRHEPQKPTESWPQVGRQLQQDPSFPYASDDSMFG